MKGVLIMAHSTDAVLRTGDYSLPGDDSLYAQTGLTAEQRVLRAQIAAATLWAKRGNPADRAAQTEAARKAAASRFADQVDPEGITRAEIADLYRAGRDEEARRREDDFLFQVGHAKSAHFRRLALASSRARARRREGGG